MNFAGVCLGTDVCVDLMRGHRSKDAGAFSALPSAALWMSAVTLSVLEFGVSGARDPRREAARLAWLSEFVAVRSFDARAAAVSGVVRGALEQQGARIGTLDALIGAHALAEGAVLMTRNVREYSRIEGLVIAEV